MPFIATQMDLEFVMLSKVSQAQKDKYDIAYMWNKKRVQMNLSTKQKQSYRYRQQTYGYQRGNVSVINKLGIWGKREEIGIDIYILL